MSLVHKQNALSEAERLQSNTEYMQELARKAESDNFLYKNSTKAVWEKRRERWANQKSFCSKLLRIVAIN